MNILFTLLNDPVIYATIFLIVIVAGGWFACSRANKIDRANARAKVTDIILESIGLYQMRLISEDMVEYTFLDLGTPERHLVWIQVRLNENFGHATICQVSDLSERHRHYTSCLIAEFKKQNSWSAEIETTDHQPEIWEYGIPETIDKLGEVEE